MTSKMPSKRGRSKIANADPAKHINAMEEIQNKYRPANTVPGALPINFSGDADPAVKRFQFKEGLKQSGILSAPGDGDITNWTVSDGDIAVYEKLANQAELRDYYSWLGNMVHLQEPGMLAWAMQMAPDYVNSQIEWFESQLDLQKEMTMIANFGPQTPRQLYMKYLLDNNRLDYGVYDDIPYSAGFWHKNPPANVSWSDWLAQFQATPGPASRANAAVPGTGAGPDFMGMTSAPAADNNAVGRQIQPFAAGAQGGARGQTKGQAWGGRKSGAAPGSGI